MRLEHKKWTETGRYYKNINVSAGQGKKTLVIFHTKDGLAWEEILGEWMKLLQEAKKRLAKDRRKEYG